MINAVLPWLVYAAMVAVLPFQGLMLSGKTQSMLIGIAGTRK